MSSPYALTTDIQDGIAVITIDLPKDPVNKFNRQVKDEFVALFDRLERDLNVRAAILRSGKKDSWIAGADIDEFLELKTAADAERMSHDGQLLLDSIERMRTPLICAIHGACLGGALEVALASAYRIATDHPKTVLALP
ncbi:MAG TPA: enoyl-CoA hydratase-related protein, partial [Burkholderiales bacterium]|nr:enoyl-CoA hydratase-related protein [Burkholderiales bacterium]